jgi:hypothetical protein
MTRRYVRADVIPGLLEEHVLSDVELSDSNDISSNTSESDHIPSTPSPPPKRRRISPARISESSDSDLDDEVVESIPECILKQNTLKFVVAIKNLPKAPKLSSPTTNLWVILILQT